MKSHRVRPVGDIDQRTRAADRGEDPFVRAVVAGRDVADDEALEIGGRGVARDVFQGRVVQGVELVVEPRREDGHARAGAPERFDASRRCRAAADDGGALALDAQKNRQSLHRFPDPELRAFAALRLYPAERRAAKASTRFGLGSATRRPAVGLAPRRSRIWRMKAANRHAQ